MVPATPSPFKADAQLRALVSIDPSGAATRLPERCAETDTILSFSDVVIVDYISDFSRVLQPSPI